jgi:hypothetical protein
MLIVCDGRLLNSTAGEMLHGAHGFDAAGTARVSRASGFCGGVRFLVEAD